MNINFLLQSDDVSWIKTSCTLFSVQAQFSLALFKVLETEVTGLSHVAFTSVSNLEYIQILCSTIKGSTNILSIPFSTNISLDLLLQTSKMFLNYEITENLHL